jgi:hypothetical protein
MSSFSEVVVSPEQTAPCNTVGANFEASFLTRQLAGLEILICFNISVNREIEGVKERWKLWLKFCVFHCAALLPPETKVHVRYGISKILFPSKCIL